MVRRKQQFPIDDDIFENLNLIPEHRKLFLGGLTYNTTDDMLKEFYGQWGELVDVIVMRDPNTKRSRGFGFVTYATKEMVDDAMNDRPHVIDGKTVEPKRAIPRELSQRSEANISVKKLYVSGVRDEHTEDMFRDHFVKFGDVIDVEIITDKNTGKARGFAFISFDDYDAVDKCVLQKSHMIDNKRCDVKKALSKDEMRKAQQQERDRMDRDTRTGGNRGFGGGSGGGRDDRGYGGSGGGGYGSQGWNTSNGGGLSQQGSGGWGAAGQWSQPGYGGGNYGGGNYGGGNYGGGGYGGQGGQGDWNRTPIGGAGGWGQNQSSPIPPQQQWSGGSGGWNQSGPSAGNQGWNSQGSWGGQGGGGQSGGWGNRGY